MASMNKCLAQSIKSRTDGNATRSVRVLPAQDGAIRCAGQVRQQQDRL